MDLNEVVERIRKCMKGEDRKDVEFRALIALTEVGDIVKYITHDPVLNPGARPHGSKADEELAYGQALIQIIATMWLRRIDVEHALEVGLRNWEDADWRKKHKVSSTVKGKTACKGTVVGVAYVVSSDRPVSAVPHGSILVINFAPPSVVEVAGRLRAIVTDHGGLTSHAAILARELNIPCIVGTGNATTVISHGSEIIVRADKNDGLVEIIGQGE